MSFTNDFRDANQDFGRFRQELMAQIKGDLVSIETCDTQLAKLFDAYAGIDAIQIIDQQLRAVAIRVQWGKAYNTFTIRYKRRSGAKTEYQKRTEAIHNGKGYLYPYLTIQAYIDKRGDAERLLSCGVVRTQDLYEYLSRNESSLNMRTCPEGNVFVYVSFDELIQSGVQLLVFGDEFKKEVKIKTEAVLASIAKDPNIIAYMESNPCATNP